MPILEYSYRSFTCHYHSMFFFCFFFLFIKQPKLKLASLKPLSLSLYTCLFSLAVFVLLNSFSLYFFECLLFSSLPPFASSQYTLSVSQFLSVYSTTHIIPLPRCADWPISLSLLYSFPIHHLYLLL